MSSITHLKLFLDQESRRVALFSGGDEARDWRRNVAAETVLKSGWHLLPKETLITVAEVEQQGFLLSGAFNEQTPQPTARAWLLRAAGLAARLADAATAAGRPEEEAACCERVAVLLEDAGEPAKRAAWLMRAVNAQLACWERDRQPAIAETVARLFGELAEADWSEQPNARKKARSNQQFWWQQAAAAWSEQSQAAETSNDLIRAEQAATAAAALLKRLELTA